MLSHLIKGKERKLKNQMAGGEGGQRKGKGGSSFSWGPRWEGGQSHRASSVGTNMFYLKGCAR